MGNLSLAFHVASLGVLLALAYGILRLQAQLKLWRDWGCPSASSRVHVGEPARVLRQFANAVGAEFYADLPLNALPPKRMGLSACFDLHRQGFVEMVSVTNRDAPCVCFVLSREPGTMNVDLEKLRMELGGSLMVELRHSTESSEA